MKEEQQINKLLIKALKSRDIKKIDAAFETIYNQYQGLIFYVSLQIVHKKEIAEDIAQDTFLKLFNSISTLNEEKNLKYWLITTAKNASYDHLKKRSTKTEILLDSDYDIRKSNDFLDDWQKIELQLKEFLEEDEIEILSLRFLFNYKFKDISKELNIPIGTVSSKYNSAVKKTRIFLERGREQ